MKIQPGYFFIQFTGTGSGLGGKNRTTESKKTIQAVIRSMSTNSQRWFGIDVKQNLQNDLSQLNQLLKSTDLKPND